MSAVSFDSAGCWDTRVPLLIAPARRELAGRCIILKPNVLKTKLPGLENYCELRVFFPVSSDRIIVDAIKVAQNLVSQNLPPAHNLTHAAPVLRVRELRPLPALQ